MMSGEFKRSNKCISSPFGPHSRRNTREKLPPGDGRESAGEAEAGTPGGLHVWGHD